MLAIVIYIAFVAFGRVSKSYGPVPWLACLVVGIATSLLSAMMMNVVFNEMVVLATALQIAILAFCYVIGTLLGRFLDRDKEIE